MIEEAYVESRVVDERRASPSTSEFHPPRTKNGLSARNASVRPCISVAALGHIALGIEIPVPENAGGDVVDQLDAGELDDAVAVLGVEPGRLGVENKFAHSAPSMRSIFVEIGPALECQRRPFHDLP